MPLPTSIFVRPLEMHIYIYILHLISLDWFYRATDKVLTELGIYPPISDLIGYFQNQLGKLTVFNPTNQNWIRYLYYFHSFNENYVYTFNLSCYFSKIMVDTHCFFKNKKRIVRIPFKIIGYLRFCIALLYPIIFILIAFLPILIGYLRKYPPYLLLCVYYM